MSSSDIRKRISGLYYGWRMIGVVSALRILGGGLHQYGFTVFFLPVTQDLGLTRASTSLAFSLARAEGSLTAPIVGYLLDRYGPKPLMLAATLFAGIGYMLFAFVHSYTTFLIVYLGVISLAFNAGFVHAPTVVANSWFIKLRARAMTVVSAAVPIGGALITPLLAVAVQNFGWRWAALVAGGLFIAGGDSVIAGDSPLAGKRRYGSRRRTIGKPPRRQERRAVDKQRCQRTGGQRAPSLSLADLLESDSIHDRALGGFHHRHDPFHSDDGVERHESDRSLGAVGRLRDHKLADSLLARLDRRLRQ